MPLVLAPPPQPHRLLLVLILARDHQVARGAAALVALRQRALEDARGHAAAHLVGVPRQRQQRGAAPQDVGGRRVGVALGRVEEEVAHPRPRNVLVLRCHVREEHARRHVRPRPELRRLLQVRFAQVREAQQPEDGLWEFGEDAEPGAEGCRFDLGVTLVWCLRILGGRMGLDRQ